MSERERETKRKRWRRREGEGKKREKTRTWRGHCVSEEMGMNLHLTGGTNYGCL